LLPEVYRAELAKLQDAVLLLPEHVIADVIREDLGAPPDSIFAFFDQTPLASASIGQVHVAQLFDGREVVVKVGKPGVDELVQIDLEILTGLLDELSPRFPVLEEYDARGLVGEFSDTLRAELDYVREAANVMSFRETFKSELGIKVPDVINEYSKNRVLTEERLKGRKASDVADLPKPRRAEISCPSADRGPITCAIRRWTSPSSPATCGGDLTASWAKSSAAIFGFGRASRTLMRC
jgi:ubiquinone biosynthesis protein